MYEALGPPSAAPGGRASPAPVVLIVALALGKRKLTGDLSPPIAGRWPWQPERPAVSLQVCGYDGGGGAKPAQNTAVFKVGWAVLEDTSS